LDSDRRKQIGDRARAEVLAEFTMERAAEFTRIRVEYLHKRHFFKRLLKAFRKWWSAKQSHHQDLASI